MKKKAHRGEEKRKGVKQMEGCEEGGDGRAGWQTGKDGRERGGKESEENIRRKKSEKKKMNGNDRGAILKSMQNKNTIHFSNPI